MKLNESFKFMHSPGCDCVDVCRFCAIVRKTFSSVRALSGRRSSFVRCVQLVVACGVWCSM